ncbi:hypothetical protein Rhopal_005165-T1 [Rhodotorula paludigena]|uniref:F-box domain-containing protein n=1 Tax=Rhodotorula paludigena TaxID=86838 RepID=A0AAV5GHM6_9BASI|nr:hypothetical protein Rhopal_005165-T1 [Rhodotorula paludigena]
MHAAALGDPVVARRPHPVSSSSAALAGADGREPPTAMHADGAVDSANDSDSLHRPEWAERTVPPAPGPASVPSVPFAASRQQSSSAFASSSPSRALSRLWDRLSPPSMPSPFSSASTPPFPSAFLSTQPADNASPAPHPPTSDFFGKSGAPRAVVRPELEQHDSASQLSFSLRRPSATATAPDPRSSAMRTTLSSSPGAFRQAWESPFRLPIMPWKGKDREEEFAEDAEMVDDEACFVDGWEGKVDFLVSLPSELALNILVQLDFRSVLAVGGVSRAWRQLACDPLLWRELFHQNPRWHIKPEVYREAARAAHAAQTASAINSPTITQHASSGYFADRPVMPNLKRAASSFGRAGAKRIVTGVDRVQQGGAVIGRKMSEIVGDLGGLSLIPGQAGMLGALSANSSRATSRAASPERAGATTPTRPPVARRVTAATSSLLSLSTAGLPSTSTLQTNAFASPPSATLSRAHSSSALSTLASMTPRRSASTTSSAVPPPSAPTFTPSTPSASFASPFRQPVASPFPFPATPGISHLADADEATLMAAAGLALDWPRLFRDRWLLERRWDRGKPSWSWFEGHTDSVYCVQFDERKIISGSRDKTIRVWDIASGETTATLTAHEGSVLCLQYDDEILVSGSSDSRVVVWDLVGDEGVGRAKYEVVQTLVGHAMGVLDLTFDDKWIVSCSKDTTTRVWNRETGELYRTLQGHRGPVNAVQMHGDRILTASGDALMKLWDLHTGTTLRTFSGHTRGLACVHWAPSGTHFVSSSNDRTIKLWNADSGECVRTFSGHTDLVRGLAWDEKSRRVVSGGYDRTTRVWDAETGEEIHRYKSHSSLVFDVAFSASAIVSASHDRKILLMDFGAGLDVSKFA